MQRKQRLSLAILLPGLLLLGAGLYIASTEATYARTTGIIAAIVGVVYIVGALILWTRRRGEIAREAENTSDDQQLRRAS